MECCSRHFFLLLDRTSIQTGLSKSNISLFNQKGQEAVWLETSLDTDSQAGEKSMPQSQDSVFPVASFSGMIPFHLCWQKKPKEAPGLSFVGERGSFQHNFGDRV